MSVCLTTRRRDDKVGLESVEPTILTSAHTPQRADDEAAQKEIKKEPQISRYGTVSR